MLIDLIRGAYPSLQDFLIQLLLSIPPFLLALSVHEAAHGWVANRCGDPTARYLGRVTLNPIAHIDPVGFICLLLFRFGWARPVPVNPRNFKNFKRDDVLVSIAGIVMNLLMVLLFSIVFAVLLVLFPQLFYNTPFLAVMGNIIGINTVLAIFNLIPIPPLDGSHLFDIAFGRVLPFKVLDFLHRYGFVLLLLILWSGVLSYPINWAMDLVYRGINALIQALL